MDDPDRHDTTWLWALGPSDDPWDRFGWWFLVSAVSISSLILPFLWASA